jgi:hypothetical protein
MSNRAIRFLAAGVVLAVAATPVFAQQVGGHQASPALTDPTSQTAEPDLDVLRPEAPAPSAAVDQPPAEAAPAPPAAVDQPPAEAARGASAAVDQPPLEAEPAASAAVDQPPAEAAPAPSADLDQPPAEAAPTQTPPNDQATPPLACGASANPWGFTYCRGSRIVTPPADLCTVFACIPTFWRQVNGYVVQCRDMLLSHSGGVRGACSGHGGELRPLYAT